MHCCAFDLFQKPRCFYIPSFQTTAMNFQKSIFKRVLFFDTALILRGGRWSCVLYYKRLSVWRPILARNEREVVRGAHPSPEQHACFLLPSTSCVLHSFPSIRRNVPSLSFFFHYIIVDTLVWFGSSSPLLFIHSSIRCSGRIDSIIILITDYPSFFVTPWRTHKHTY